MNTLKKVVPFLLGITVMISTIYSCEDDKEDSNVSNMEQLVKDISKIGDEINKFVQALENGEATQRMESAAESLKEAAAAKSSETSPKLAELAQAILTAAQALKAEGEDSQGAGHLLEQAARQIKEAAEQHTQKGTAQKLDKVLPLLQEAKELIAVTMSGKSSQEDEKIQSEPAEEKMFVKTITSFYAPLSKQFMDSGRYKESIFGQLVWYQIDTFTKFDFASGKEVPADSDEWDIALAGNILIINGGEKYKDVCDKRDTWLKAIGPHPLVQPDYCLVDKIQPERTGKAALYFAKTYEFDEIKNAKEFVEEEGGWRQDTAEERALEDDLFSFDHSGYSYKPIGGILIFKTRNGKYAKVQMISCYKDPHKTDVTEKVEYMYYTFKYAYNPTGSPDLDTSSMEQPSNAREYPKVYHIKYYKPL